MKDKPTVIAVVNQKGGTAKTTTVENLGIGLAREGKKVLLVDTDPQGSLTISLGYPRPDELDVTVFDLLSKTINEDTVHAGEGILHQSEGIDLIPANISLAGLEVKVMKSDALLPGERMIFGYCYVQLFFQITLAVKGFVLRVFMKYHKLVKMVPETFQQLFIAV